MSALPDTEPRTVYSAQWFEKQSNGASASAVAEVPEILRVLPLP